MAPDMSLWTRREFEGIPIYIREDLPNWFVPNSKADAILRSLSSHVPINGDIHTQRLLDRINDPPASSYVGRSAVLTIDHLKELWFHITNRCNLSCRHCLVSSGPQEQAKMPARRILEIAEQAYEAGTRVFALTGGEPFVHPEFESIVDGLLAWPDTNVVVLTNGTLLRRSGDWLRRRTRDRFHLQISVDGMQGSHDRIRGQGAFAHLEDELRWLAEQDTPFTVSMCVTKSNVDEMPSVVGYAAARGVGNVHFMWYFIRGRGQSAEFADPDRIFERFLEAAERAEELGISLDNIESLKSQVFVPTGTKFDGSSSGWESIAIGPEGYMYPTPALIGVPELVTPLNGNLVKTWKESPVLAQLRKSSVMTLDHPLKYIIGGGDSDHSFLHGGSFIGADPYWPLYEQTVLWLIAREAAQQPDGGPLGLRLKMGDVLESCGSHGPVALVHNNCLLAVAGRDGHTAVKEFYTEVAQESNEDILNPVCYPEDVIDHIPPASRVRSYGCGSPVLDANLQPGDDVVDLGCGPGVECFIAARLVGREGHVMGVDMLEPMLNLARNGAEVVSQNLGYANLDFRQGYLETLPLENDSVDVVLSNCVINLSPHKRKTFQEILRILRPGGRLVIADVVCESEPDSAVRNNDKLRGECIGGALAQQDLFGILEESGFVNARVMKRFPYRRVKGHSFFSMTFEARKPETSETVKVMYRGPMAAMVTHSGRFLRAGQTYEIDRQEVAGCGPEIFEFNQAGRVQNLQLDGETTGCGCTGPDVVEEELKPSSNCSPAKSGPCC